MPSKMMKPPAKKVNVAGQEHSLAYINKNEERMLRRMGGSGQLVNGIPAFPPTEKDSLGRDKPGGGFEGGGDGGGMKDESGASTKDFDSGYVTQAQQRLNRIADAKKQLQDRINNKNITGLGAYLPSGMAMNAGNKMMRSYMSKQLDDPNLVDVVFDDEGNYAGNVTKGLFGFNVYTGKQIAGYTGPYANIAAQDPTGSDKDDRVQARIVRDYGGGKLSEDKKDGVNLTLPDAPDAPGNVGDGDQTELAKKKSSLGQESTIGTSAQGLLSGARTRRRSLMSGLLA